MDNSKNIDPLIEWAVFAHLDTKKDLELILLKGHLLLEMVMEVVLKRNSITYTENHSFYRKILLLEEVNYKNPINKDFIISSLKDINKLRNRLAHEFQFDISKGELENIGAKILNNLKGEKFTKYTYRTKIVHAFSVLSKSLLQ